MRHLAGALAGAILLASQAGATTFQLDFTGSGTIPDTFGDTAEANLSYRGLPSLSSDPTWGSGLATNSTLQFWTTGYGSSVFPIART